MLADFHMHTFLSDGELSPMELVRRCSVNGYTLMAITDHASPSVMERQIAEAARDASLAAEQWGLKVLIGVELTHVPAASIDKTARLARELGAQVVVVHGETMVEPVEAGTNRASIESRWVDILAHPGMLTDEEAQLAASNGTFLEITARKGHCLGNGRTAALAVKYGAHLIINSDTHAPGDILTASHARNVALGAGLSAEQAEKALQSSPEKLLLRIAKQAEAIGVITGAR